MAMDLPCDVRRLLDSLLANMRLCLGDGLIGVYLRGSLALGDFSAETSDVDVLAATARPVTAAEFERLRDLHALLAASANPYGKELEIAYVDCAALRRFEPGLRHPTLGRGETLTWTEHHANWVLERWAVRERGVILFGPDPATLIDPISHSALAKAVHDRLGDWADWAMQEDDPDWLLPRRHKAYVVETMCRALYALAQGELVSKREAVDWACQALPEPMRSTAERSRQWRTDDTADDDIIPEVRRFVLWAAAYPPRARN